ncbi:hypothetical protein F5Y19DRAFT_479675 [Xylariaceae sp. FL1651]|nr:hypothetical protein F5Y19DRAFT_479675 [Xylariaceae sp. FL1651]
MSSPSNTSSLNDGTSSYHAAVNSRTCCTFPNSYASSPSATPGCQKIDIRTSAIFLSFSFTVAALGVLTVAVTDGALEFWNPWILGFAIANPTCIIATVWLSLALANRKRERLGGGGYDELTEKAEDSARKYGTAGNTGLERSLQAIWTTAVT